MAETVQLIIGSGQQLHANDFSRVASVLNFEVLKMQENIATSTFTTRRVRGRNDKLAIAREISNNQIPIE